MIDKYQKVDDGTYTNIHLAAKEVLNEDSKMKGICRLVVGREGGTEGEERELDILYPAQVYKFPEILYS